MTVQVARCRQGLDMKGLLLNLVGAFLMGGPALPRHRLLWSSG